jgi:hypothetical protein
MTLPRLTAGFGIGPAGGTYGAASRPGMHTPTSGPGPQAVTPAMLGGADFIAALDNCQPPQHPCMGNGDYAGQWVCCDGDRPCVPNPQTGEPVCGPREMRRANGQPIQILN